MAACRDPAGLSPMLAGTLGGLLATSLTFTPCFLSAGQPGSGGALFAITAAVVGVVLNLATWFAIHTVFREVRRVEG